jgi:hypothetical protein
MCVPVESGNLGVDFCNQGVDAHGGYSPVPKIAPGRGSASAFSRLEASGAAGNPADDQSRAWAGW